MSDAAMEAALRRKAAGIYWLNLAGFVIVSMFCYQGALRDRPWLGLAVLPVMVALLLPLGGQPWRRLALMAGIGVGGFMLDTALVAAGIYAAAPSSRWLLPAPLCPEWILALWLNFGFMLFISWRNLRGKVWAGVLCGFVFAFIIYGRARSQGIIEIPSPAWARLGTIGVLWAIIVPLLIMLTGRVTAAGNKGVRS